MAYPTEIANKHRRLAHCATALWLLWFALLVFPFPAGSRYELLLVGQIGVTLLFFLFGCYLLLREEVSGDAWNLGFCLHLALPLHLIAWMAQEGPLGEMLVLGSFGLSLLGIIPIHLRRLRPFRQS